MTKKVLEKDFVKWLKQDLTEKGYIVFKMNERFSSGFPDLICIKAGRVIFMEVKIKDNKVTKLQNLVLDMLAKAGAEALVARHLDTNIPEDKYVTKFYYDEDAKIVLTEAWYYKNYKF